MLGAIRVTGGGTIQFGATLMVLPRIRSNSESVESRFGLYCDPRNVGSYPRNWGGPVEFGRELKDVSG
jgi:hypothetical protein